MALTKGVNSYATVAEADVYFADRLDVAAWTAADETQKAQALVTATAMLDSKEWTGVAISESQELAFPREGAFFDPRVGYTVGMPTNGAPTRVVKATFELAHHLLNNDGLLDDTGQVDSLKIGNIQLENVRNPEKFPSNVRALIQPLLQSKAGLMWWRAN
jgi:hypothetical protein